MGLILSRPFLINESYSRTALPNSDLERDTSSPEVPSPITQIVLQCQVFHRVMEHLLPTSRQPLYESVLAIIKSIEIWFSELPPVFREHEPDKSHDRKHPFLIRHRLQVQSMGYVTTLTLLKPFLTSQTSSTTLPAEFVAVEKLRRTAIDYAIKVMGHSRLLFDMFIPDNPKYFYVILMPFDTASLLCSAWIHDKEQTLPRRKEILEAIGEAVRMIRALRSITKVGPVAWSVIQALLPEMKLTEAEASLVDSDGLILKHRRPTKRPMMGSVAPKEFQSVPLDKTKPNHTILTPESSSSTSTANSDFDWNFDPAQALDSIPLTDLDFGNLDQVWDWGELNIPFEDFNVPLNDFESTLMTESQTPFL